ncbi:MAG: hypothetical protein JKY50_02280 [Oleispira sp.]|nr:hypothetical protein [Oleispira sp.]MBL4881039.1 hypothetical protein [Oleispira sp.]
MTKRPTKREIRQQMNNEVEQYLNKGGAVQEFERGESGLINGKIDERSTGFNQGKQERTPLTDVLNAVDERKKSGNQISAVQNKRPRKKIIYDDFGEAIREVWVDG